MKATELMVCDWVLDGKKPAQITGIMCDDLFETTLSPSVGGECISPIPLTMELIEKNGLSQLYTDFYDFDMFEFNDGLFRAIYSNCEFSDIPDESVLISYVHELQHFLRHLKIDKEIVL